MKPYFTALIVWFITFPPHLYAHDFSGFIAGEVRYFPDSPLYADQFSNVDVSLSFQPEYTHSWDDGYQTFAFVPFVRVDKQDEERTHFDIRELTWVKAAQDWELRLGVRKVFWGVTESQHLVDIINQTDLVENMDGEDKLGQPMANFAWIQEWGTLDFFLLPYFRERTFPGKEGRLYPGIPIDTDNPLYQSGAKEKHVDWAVRWSRPIDNWDIGISHFSGTGRDPDLLPRVNQAGQLVLQPYYKQINQTGVDIQMTQEEWLWKLELISRKMPEDRFTAFTGGFEYTFVGIFDSDADIGVIGEYLHDDRGKNATTPFDNDLMMGLRLTLNDVQSTELLAGVVVDLDKQGQFYNLEASRRLGNDWKLSLEARAYGDLDEAETVYPLRNDNYIQLELAWYF